jgi:hypothetical protein
MNGIHEVTGSIPVWSTNLRSPAFVSELRLASQPSVRFRAKVAHPQARSRQRHAKVVHRSP